jgi:hypothetical protein
MAFRRYGGLSYAPNNNIFKTNYVTSNNLTISEQIGLSGVTGATGDSGSSNSTRIVNKSDIDVNYNDILNVGCIRFADGTTQCTAATTMPLTSSKFTSDATILIPFLVKEIQNLRRELNELKFDLQIQTDEPDHPI